MTKAGTAAEGERWEGGGRKCESGSNMQEWVINLA